MLLFQGISIHQNVDDRQEDAQNLRQVYQPSILVSVQNNTIYTQLNYSLTTQYKISQI